MLHAYALYLAGSLIVAVLGKNRRFGFWGYLFASLLLSPMIGLILILASDRRKIEPAPRA